MIKKTYNPRIGIESAGIEKKKDEKIAVPRKGELLPSKVNVVESHLDKLYLLDPSQLFLEKMLVQPSLSDPDYLQPKQFKQSFLSIINKLTSLEEDMSSKVIQETIKELMKVNKEYQVLIERIHILLRI